MTGLLEVGGEGRNAEMGKTRFENLRSQKIQRFWNHKQNFHAVFLGINATTGHHRHVVNHAF